MTSTMLPGTEVRARGLRWEVVYTQPAGEQSLYRLRCLSDALRGHELDILSPFEEIRPERQEIDPERAAPLQHWRLYHQAFLLEQALGAEALLAAKAGRLVLAPYQLVPVMRSLSMSRPRLLLADGVGLGKTIQAGLILAELIARRRAHRILIVTPPGPLMDQWRVEMRDRFGLRFTALDNATLTEIRYKQELGANPFDHEALGIISIDFAKQEKILKLLERTQYDLIVVDEAHHCASLGTAAQHEDSRRRRLAEVLARRSDGLLLLTATPHDGYDPHFASIVELLDPSLVDGRGSLRGDSYRRYVVRRLKRHITKPDSDEPMFRERVVTPVAVGFSSDEHRQFADMQRALVALVAPLLRRATRARRYGDVLAFVSLLKRSVSTAAACRSTLQTVADRFEVLAEQGAEADDSRRQRIRTLREYHRRIERFGALSEEEEQDQRDLEAEDMAAELNKRGATDLMETLNALRLQRRRERRKQNRLEETHEGLRALVDIATAATDNDPKLAALVDAIRSIRASEPNTNVLIYTEYTDSQRAAVSAIRAAIEAQELSGAVLSISGDDPYTSRQEGAKSRTSVIRRFKEEDNLILISTDATAEGLDLHVRCHHLLHLELPYNPNRLEQRNGRIDRFGQQYDPQVKYLYLAGTFEERLLLRLVAKYERQRAKLTFVPNTLGGATSANTTERLLAGIADDGELELFKRSQSQVSFDADAKDDQESEAYRELLGEVERAFNGFQKAAKTNTWLGKDGLHADKESVDEAHQACLSGIRVGIVDIVDFVLDAVRAESARGAVKQLKDKTWELKLTGNWRHGLDELPGFDPKSGVLRLTTDMNQTHNAKGDPVGYLGRAHPLVRRAIDRVRNVQFGSNRDALDRRVSAASHDGDSPELLLTFLGRIMSGEGREFERVVAVRLSAAGAKAKVHTEYQDWAGLVAPERMLPTKDIWKKHFAEWGSDVRDGAQGSAAKAFEKLAKAHLAKHKEQITDERQTLEAWLRDRCKQLCGEVVSPEQTELFGANSAQEAAAWQTARDPKERLTALAADRSVSIARRSEAQSALNLYTQRTEVLDRRADIRPADVSPLGMLMLVPKEVA